MQNLAIGNFHTIKKKFLVTLFSKIKELCPSLKSFSFVLGTMEKNNLYGESNYSGCLQLVEINSDLINMQIDEEYTDPGASWEVKITSIIGKAKGIYKAIRKEITKREKTLDFKVVTIAHKIQTSAHSPDVYLIPRLRQQFRVGYFAQKDIQPNTQYGLCFAAFPLTVFCREDGILDSPYDGIGELFDET